MAAITSAVLAVGTAGYQIYNAEQQKKDAKEAINDFQRQDLVNPYENVQISTEKSEQQTEANLVNTATSVEALRRGGTRAVLGGIPRINQNNILLQNMISADLDKQEKERQLRIAQGEEQIRAIREGRETRSLQALGQSLQTARQDSATGISNLVSGGLALGSLLENTTPQVDVESVAEASDVTELSGASQLPTTFNLPSFATFNTN